MTPGFCTYPRLEQTLGFKKQKKPGVKSGPLFVNPESGFDSGFLYLPAFRANTGFQKAQETRCEERT